MEFLKFKSWVVVLLLAWYGNVCAQNGQASVNAFKASYQYEAKGEYVKAIDAIKAVYDEKSYEMNLRLGWLYYSAGKQTESLSYYKTAMALKPYAIEPCLGFALPASVLGKWDEILEVYNKVLVIDPNNTLINFRKGLILYNRADFLKAEKCFEKVVNLYPFDYDGVHMLAWTKFKLQKTSEAKVLFQKALYARPDDKSAQEGLKLIK